uniref:SAP domain-containing protein n=1 Tax=Timema cristinae TaxID=61476 RepID=A0A7R9CNW9_TIMCR|nr:unnamed protein product [Timema cristinae]
MCPVDTHTNDTFATAESLRRSTRSRKMAETNEALRLTTVKSTRWAALCVSCQQHPMQVNSDTSQITLKDDLSSVTTLREFSCSMLQSTGMPDALAWWYLPGKDNIFQTVLLTTPCLSSSSWLMDILYKHNSKEMKTQTGKPLKINLFTTHGHDLNLALSSPKLIPGANLIEVSFYEWFLAHATAGDKFSLTSVPSLSVVDVGSLRTGLHGFSRLKYTIIRFRLEHMAKVLGTALQTTLLVHLATCGKRLLTYLESVTTSKPAFSPTENYFLWKTLSLDQNMILSFSVSQLQALLDYAGRNKSGRKTELQSRAVDLLKLHSTPVNMKIKALYKSFSYHAVHIQVEHHTMESERESRARALELGYRRYTFSVLVFRISVSVKGQGYTPSTSQPPNSTSSMSSSRQSTAAYTSAAIQHQSNQMRTPIYPGYLPQHANPQMPSQLHPPMYSTPYPHPYTPKLSAQSASPNYPVHPDVRLKKLPFYDILVELIKPSSLVHPTKIRTSISPSSAVGLNTTSALANNATEAVPKDNGRPQNASFSFHLTPQQATDVTSSRDCRLGGRLEFVNQIQMRFCHLETSCEQEDFMPPGLGVNINGQPSKLPPFIPSNKQGVEPKRSNRPVDITTYVKLSPLHANYIDVGWNSDYGSAYVIAVYLVRMLVTADLLQRMRAKGARQSDFTRGLTIERLRLRPDWVSKRLKNKVEHIGCNERWLDWNTHSGRNSLGYRQWAILLYFQDVLSSSRLTQDSTEIQLHQDGSWSTLAVKVEHSQAISPVLGKSAMKIEVISDDLEVITDSRSASSKDEPKKHVDAVTVDLTLSDSDEETETVTKNKVVEEKTDSSNQSSPPSKQETDRKSNLSRDY